MLRELYWKRNAQYIARCLLDCSWRPVAVGDHSPSGMGKVEPMERRAYNCPIIDSQVGHRSCDWGGPGVLTVLGEQS